MSETTHPVRAEPSPFVPGVRPPEPASIVIFGGTGDLATRKLFPALFGLWYGHYLPERFLIAGVSNLEFTDDSFRELVAKHTTILRQQSGASNSLNIWVACFNRSLRSG